MSARTHAALSSIVPQLILLTKNGAIGAAAGYVLTIVLARVLGPADFGLYSYVLIFSSICVLLITFATDATAPMQYAKSHDKNEVLCFVFSVRGLFFCLFLLGILGWSLFSPTVAFGVLAASITSLNLGFLYEMSGANVRFSYIALIEKLLYVAAAFLLVLLGLVSVKSVFLVLLIASSVSLIWQGRQNYGALQGFRFDIEHVRRAGKSSIFLVIASLSTFAYGGFSRIVLEERLGLKELGIYSAGWQLILAVTIFQAQVDRVWRVALSSDVLRNDSRSLHRHIKEYLLLTTLPVIALSLLLFYFSDEVVDFLYGNEYQPLTTVLPVIAVYFVIINVDGLARMFWIALGKFREYAGINLATGVGLLVLLAIQPLHYGLKGFAISVTFAHGIAVAVLMMRFCRIYVKRLLAA